MALIPAAGTGTRCGGEVPKQYVQLAGQTMLAHAVDAVLADPRVDGLLVVVAPTDTRWRDLSFDARVRFLPVGGASRADSVRNGLHELAAQPQDWILVHDAARPCLAAAELACLLDALEGEEVGALLAAPVADTLQRAQGERAVATVERNGLWRAATPQVLRAGLLARALAAAGASQHTDEASAVQALGAFPRLVAGEATNLKVTTAADWPLAAAILQMQGRGR